MGEPSGVDELMCAVIARQVTDGDVLLEGIGAFLPSVGYELARILHAPNAVVFTPVGTVFRREALRPSLGDLEAQAVRAGARRVTYGEMALQYLPAYIGRTKPVWREFARPAQVDGWGNTNNVTIGPYGSPTIRLPGAVGIPDGTSLLPHVHLYVPRHSDRVMVQDVDFVSGLGWRRSEPRPGAKHGRPRLLVSDLGVIGFDPKDGARLLSTHPGVHIDDVVAATGFPLDTTGTVVTEPPTSRELEMLRTEVDPLGLRRLELAAARDRRHLLRLALNDQPLPSARELRA